MPTLFKLKPTNKHGGKESASSKDEKIKKLQAENRRLRAQVKRMNEGNPSVPETALEVTGHKQPEEALRQSEEKWRSLVNNTPDFIALHDREGKYLFLNHYSEGFTEKDVVGSSLYNYLAPESKELFKKKFEECLSAGVTQKFEHRAMGNAGKWNVYEEYLVPLMNMDNEVNVLAVARDITERKRAEDELRATHQILETIFDQTHIMMAYLDPQMNFVRVNRAYAMADEREPSFYPGRNHFDLFPNAENEAIFHRVVETGTPYYVVAKAFEYAEHPERGVSHWDWSLVPIKDEDGSVSGLILTLINVTERVLAEEKLRESEREYRRLINLLPSGVVVHCAGQIILANNASAKFFGADSPEQLVGSALIERVHPDYRNIVGRRIQQSMQKETIAPLIQEKLLRLDGTSFDAEVAAMAIQYADKPSVLAMFNDITDRKQADEKLRESEDRYRDLVENSRELICTHDLEGNILSVNSWAVKVMGVDTGERLVGKKIPDFLVPEYRDKYKDYLEALQRDGRADGILAVQNAKGERRIWEYNNTLRTEGVSSPIVRGTAIDVTERKQAEKKLIESEQKFRNLVEQSSEGFTLLDEQGVIIEWNSAREKMTGMLREDVLGKAFWDVQAQLLVPEEQTPERFEQNKLAITNALRTGKSYLFEKTINMEVMTSKGDRRFFEQTVFPIKTNLGYRIGSITRDITERKRDALLHEVLYQVLRAVSIQLDVDLVAHSAVETIVSLTDYPHVCIALPDEDGAHWVVRGAAGSLAAELGGTYPIYQGVIGRGFKTGQIQWVHDILDDPDYVRDVSTVNAPALRSEFVVPMRHGDRLLGMLNIESDHVDAFDDADARMFKSVADVISLALENARLYAEAQQEITERKRTMQALLESEEKYRLLVENAGEALYVVQNGLVVFVNPMFEKIAGLPSAELIGKSMLDFVLEPKDRVAAIKNHQRVLRGKVENAQREFKAQMYSGTELWIKVNEVRTTWKGEPATLNYATDITELRQMIEALRQAEEKYRGIFENATEGIFQSTPEGCFITVNSSFARMLGYDSPQEVVTKVTDIASQLYTKISRRTEFTQLMADKGNVSGFEYEMRRKDGSLIWVSESARVVRDEKGGILYYEGVAEDTTERKRAEKKLQESEERFRSLYDNSTIGLFRTTPGGEILLCNPAGMQMLGYASFEELRQRNLEEEGYQPQYPRKEFREKLEREGSIVGLESAWAKKDGSTIYVRESARVIRDENGNVLYYDGTFEDITERKRTEDALRESEKNLKHSQRIAHVGHWTWNIQDNTLSGSEEIGNIFGVDVPNFSGDLNEIARKTIHPDDLQMVFDMMAPENRHINSGEFRIIRGDGTIRHIWAEPGDSVKDAQGNIIQLSGIMQDITERKQAELALREAHDRLEERVRERTAELVHANRAKDEFLASMSHELRTPLNGIMSLSESLEEGTYGQLQPRQIEILHMIAESGKHLLELINDILDLSKIEAGKLELQPETVKVESLCQASLRIIKQTAMQKRLKVSSSIASDIDTIYVDERRVKQMIVNLLSNAVKFTREGGQVGLEVKREGDEAIRFTVWDTGIGISKDKLDKLFKPFVQLDSSLSKQYSGTGLGLALVRDLAELHGGSVGVESEPGKGSRFHFTISTHLVQEDASTESVETDRELTRQNVLPQSSTTILLVEDNKINMMVTGDYLIAKGYKVITAVDGTEGIDQARTIKPRLILMDIQMPGMDGLEAIRRIRATPELASIPIIAITALAMPGDRERCLEAGANEYVAKPIRLKKLTEMIESFLK